MKTTLNAINRNPFRLLSDSELLTLLSYLGKFDDEPISLITILKSNGFQNALVCLADVIGFDREKRLFAVFCAKQVKHLMKDERSLNAVEVAERYANGLATKEELEYARYDALAALRENFHSVDIIACRAAFASVHYDASIAARHASIDVDNKRMFFEVNVGIFNAALYPDTNYLSIKTAQLEEFIRMVNCIENDKTYTLNKE